MEKKKDKKIHERWSNNDTTLFKASKEEREKMNDLAFKTMQENLENLKKKDNGTEGKNKK